MPGRGDLSHSRHWSSPGTFRSGDWCLSRCEVILNPDFFHIIVLFLIYFASFRKFQGSFNSGDRWRMKVLVQLNEFDQNETCWATPEPGLIAASIAVSPHLNPEISHGTRLINIVTQLTVSNQQTNFDVCRRALKTTYKCRPASLTSKITCQGTNNWAMQHSPVQSFQSISFHFPTFFCWRIYRNCSIDR